MIIGNLGRLLMLFTGIVHYITNTKNIVEPHLRNAMEKLKRCSFYEESNVRVSKDKLKIVLDK